MKKLYQLTFKLIVLTALVFTSHFSMAKIDTVLVSNFAFSPDSLTMNLGDTIEWVWVSGDHTTTSSNIPTGATSWDEPISSSSTSFLYLPADTGLYEYVCTPHAPNMAGLFIVRQCLSTSFMDTVSSCGPYQLNDSTYSSSGLYRQILTNAQGCDSILSVVLTIDTVDTDITQLSDTLTVDEANASYQWYMCDTAMLAIPGATSQSYTISTSGNYAVVVTTANCVDTSACLNYTVVGVDEHALINSIFVYPNPSNGFYNVKLPKDLTNASLNVYNNLGQLVYSRGNFSGNTFYFSLSDLNEGLYFLEIIENNNSMKLKLIKE